MESCPRCRNTGWVGGEGVIVDSPSLRCNCPAGRAINHPDEPDPTQLDESQSRSKRHTSKR